MSPKYVASKELSEKLKEAGFPQDTEFYWFTINNEDSYLTHKRHVEALIKNNRSICATPLTDELLKWLPEDTEIYKRKDFHIIKSPIDTKNRDFRDWYTAKADTLPDALAQMGIYLLKEGLM